MSWRVRRKLSLFSRHHLARSEHACVDKVMFLRDWPGEYFHVTLILRGFNSRIFHFLLQTFVAARDAFIADDLSVKR